ncbi:hypothetical protein ACS0TY_023118 [Phlomoides rotata]
MEVSMIRSSQVNLRSNGDVGLFNLGKNSSAKICNLKNNYSEGCCFVHLKMRLKSAVNFTLRASSSVRSEAIVNSQKDSRITRTRRVDGAKLFVGLPLDAVSSSNTIKHDRAIAAGLKALKLLGVDGVELPVWWGVAEKEAMGKYQWTSYLSIVEMVQKLGLKLHVSLCFHASDECKIRLPDWVSRIGEQEPGVYFSDRSGETYKGCLSFAADDLPVLDGKTPVEVYKEFCENFKSAFSQFIGSTITGISVSLGPEGELRYPSRRRPANATRGAGEFQCYDKNMLSNLKQHAETNGNPLWGLGGPHDAPAYDKSPLSGGFFAEKGGSWKTPYGDFFLSWYSNQLISHGDRMLSLAASAFKNSPVTVSGKVPVMQSSYQTQSHPSELTAGFYNTANRDGYQDIAQIFSKSGCKMILPVESCSSPGSLVGRITSSCREHGVDVSGESVGGSVGLDQLKKLMDEDSLVDLLTYQRMGAYFFDPKHFSAFTQFVRGLNQPIRRSKDVRMGDGREVEVESLSGSNHHMQTA